MTRTMVMKNDFYAFRRMVFLFVLFLLVSCNLKFKEPLKVGTNVWPGYEIFYLARSLEFHEDYKLKLIELPSESEVVEAFGQHLLDVAAVSLGEALILAQEQSDVRIILVVDFSHGGDAVLAKGGIKNLAGIKGKRVGIEEGVVGKILLNNALKKANLQPTDIKIVPLYKNEQLAAYQNNKVDVVMTSEPVKTQLTELGATSLFDSSQFPNKIIRVLVTHQQVIEEHEADLKKLVASYFKALAYFNSSREKASLKIAPRLMINPFGVATLYKGLILSELNDNKQLLLETEPELAILSEALIKWMLEKKLLFKNIDIKQLITTQFLPERVAP